MTKQQVTKMDEIIAFYEKYNGKKIDEDNMWDIYGYLYELNLFYNEFMAPEFSTIYNETEVNKLKWHLLDYFIKVLMPTYKSFLRQHKIDSIFE